MARYVYFVTHDYDYDGYDVISVETSAKKAITIAEKNQGGDYTTVLQYVVGSGSVDSKMIAQWKRIIGGKKFKRMT